MVILLECVDFLSDSVAIYTYVKWIPILSISHGIDKVTCVFQFAFVITIGIFLIEFILLHQFMTETWSCIKKVYVL